MPQFLTDRVNTPWREKTGVAGIHAAITVLPLLGLWWLVRYQWYPHPYFETDGGREGIGLLVAIALVLGPLLTLVTYTPARPPRQRAQELGLVGLVQLFALAWASAVVYTERPVAVVAWHGVFYSNTAKLYVAQGVRLPELQTLSPERPPLIHARPEIYPHEYANTLLLMLYHRTGQPANASLYQRIARHPEVVFGQRPPLERLMADTGELERRLAHLARHLNEPQEALVVVPFEGRYGRALLVFSPDGHYHDALVL